MREEVRIGVTWSRSGWCWLDSTMLSVGTRVWVEETNAAGGMFVPEAGRKLPVRLLWEDDRSDPDIESAAVSRLIERDRIDVFCSSASAEMQHEALPITEAHRVVNLNVGSPDSALFDLGYRYHLQCSAPLHGYLRSRPAFWKRHGLTRIAQLYADFWGWNAVAAPLSTYVEEVGGLEMVCRRAVPRSEKHSTDYGPYPRDFDGWPEVVGELVAAEPDAVVISLPSPAQYRIMREMRRQGVWFRYLEMMYGMRLSRVGFGPEDLLYQFQGSGTPRVDIQEINVGGTQAELDHTAQRLLLGVEIPAYGRTYVGLAIWAYLVREAGSMDPDAVMAQAQAESGKVVTMFGPMIWLPDGDAVPGEGWMDGVSQILRHPWTGELRPIPVYPDAAAEAEPVFTREPYERRPAPWAGAP
jgi:substrate-binding family protein